MNELLDNDAVIGSAEDGGFYLLGVRACPEGLLAGLPWSKSFTHAQTLRRLKTQGWRVAQLPEWYDVEDLERLKRNLGRGVCAAPASYKALGLGWR